MEGSQSQETCDRCDSHGILKSCQRSFGFVGGFRSGMYCLSHGNLIHRCRCKHEAALGGSQAKGSE